MFRTGGHDLRPAYLQIAEYATSKLKICMKMRKDGKLLKQNRKLELSPTGKAPDPAVLQELADI